jgi:hypothetical protein
VIAALADPQILQVQSKNGPECRKGRRRVRLAPSPQQNGLIAPEITSDISATPLNSPLMQPFPGRRRHKC